MEQLETYYVISRLSLDWGSAVVDITLRDNTGETQTYTYSGAEATRMIQRLNTADLSSNSLHRRVLAKMLADGRLSGTISGTP